MVQTAVTTKEQPEGDLHEAWKVLEASYDPVTAKAKVELTTEYHNNALKNVKTDPDIWFNELKDTRI